MKQIVLLVVTVTSGCILPISTGAPLPPTTVGQGKVGFAFSGEAPTLDLIAGGSDYKSTYAAAPAAAATLTVAYGVGEHTDVELAAEGALYYFLLPLPTGASIGFRHHLDVGDAVDLGIAAKLGGVGVSDSTTDSRGNTTTRSSASAIYGAFQAVLATRQGQVRPMLAASVMPFRIKRHPEDEPEVRFNGEGSSLTAGLMLVGRGFLVTPYVAVTNFQSQQFSGGWFVSGGILFAVRRDRNRPRPPDFVPASPVPGYYPPPPPAAPGD
jgi:hypothetical protein